jgi:HSP20 family protein
MEIKKYAPWNWFQNEKDEEQSVPVYHDLTRDIPTYPISQLHRQIDRLFDDAFRGFPSRLRKGWDWPVMEPIVLSPNLDIKETNENYVVSVEVPGVAKGNVDIQIDGNVLRISGQKMQEKKGEKENYHCVERHYGKFERVLTLPQDANIENIDAKFKDGILTINIKRKVKAAPKEAKKIEVKAA